MMTQARSIYTKQAAQMLRARLRTLYPTTHFSVRFRSYSIGSSIEVRWQDGPPEREVQNIADAYSGSRFDGMDDSTYHVYSWLLPDGSAVGAELPGDRYSKPDPAEAPKGAELVSFSGSRPHCDRTVTDGFIARCERAWAKLPVDYKCTLLNSVGFPRWEGLSDGAKLARFVAAP